MIHESTDFEVRKDVGEEGVVLVRNERQLAAELGNVVERSSQRVLSVNTPVDRLLGNLLHYRLQRFVTSARLQRCV